MVSINIFFSKMASSTVQLPDWKPPTQHTFIMQPKTVRREKQSSHHVDKKNLQQSVINWCSSSKATTLDSSWPKKHKRTTRANMTVVEKKYKMICFWAVSGHTLSTSHQCVSQTNNNPWLSRGEGKIESQQHKSSSNKVCRRFAPSVLTPPKHKACTMWIETQRRYYRICAWLSFEKKTVSTPLESLVLHRLWTEKSLQSRKWKVKENISRVKNETKRIQCIFFITINTQQNIRERGSNCRTESETLH